MKLPIFSDSFKEFLISIKKESRIARLILSVIQLYNDGFIHMLPRVLTTTEINYITYRSDGNISFLPAGKEHITNEDNTWSRVNRQSGKPAKIIRKLFTTKMLELIKEKDFEIFNNYYKCKFDTSKYTFELHPNTKIRNIYDMELEEGGSSLNNSCMNDKSYYLEIYENCNELQILSLTNDNNELAGRALIWNIKYLNIILMDRVYVSQDYLYDLFIEYAKNNNFWYKRDYKSMHNKKTFINPEGEVEIRYFKIYTDTDFEYYPYIDTFQYGGDGYLTNEEGCSDYEYCNTDGERNGNGRVYDDIDNCDIDQEDACTITAGESRYIDCTTHIENIIEINGEYYYINDSNVICINDIYYDKNDEDIVEIDCEYYYIDDCCFDVYNNEYALEDYCVYSVSMSGYILAIEAYEVDGKYYHESEVQKL
jgi:hypothetical protein